MSYVAATGNLKVSYDVKNNNYFQHCFEVSNLQLYVRNSVPQQLPAQFFCNNLNMPNGYFFGLTAHTGDVADNHDVYVEP